MGVTLTDVLLFGKAQSDDVDNATLVIYRRNILRWSALGGYLDIIVHGISPISLPDAIADSLEYLKAFGGTEQRNIPAEYTQVEYLESDGNQYIDTGIVLKSEATITTVGQSLQSVATGPNSFWGFMGSASDLPRWGWSVYSYRWLPDLNTTSQISVQADTNKHTFVNTCYYNNGVLEYDSLLDGNSISSGTVENAAQYTSNTLSAYLFARNNNGSVGNTLSCRIFSYEIVQDGVKVLSLVPCRRKSDSVLGMYDTVSGKFFTNAGTGTFTAGADAVPSPEAPMDIVSNNGVLKLSPNLWNPNATSNYWINTEGNLIGNANSRMVRVPANPDDVFTLSATYSEKSDRNIVVVSFRDSSDNNLSRRAVSSNTSLIITSTAPAGTKSVCFARFTETPTTIQAESGSTATPYVPYGAIYADGTVETINVHGKNLLDVNSSGIVAGYLASDGSLVQSTSWSVSDYIPIKANTTFTYSTTRPSGGLGSGAYLAYYDANYAFISTQNQGSNANKTFTTPAGTAYVKVSFFSSGNWQVERGSTATDYVPYYDGGTAVAEMLLKVGDYEDVQSIIDGAVTRNIGIKVFDGTENWSAGSAPNPNRFALAGAFNDIAQIPNRNVGYSNCYKVIERSTSIQSNLQNNECGWNTTYVFCVRDDRFDTVAQFTAWLAGQYNAGTPVIIVYPLETPTTESVTGQPMQVQQGDNFVEITQASLDNLEIEAKYQAAVSLTIQEVQDANLDPNVQVTIN